MWIHTGVRVVLATAWDTSLRDHVIAFVHALGEGEEQPSAIVIAAQAPSPTPGGSSHTPPRWIQ